MKMGPELGFPCSGLRASDGSDMDEGDGNAEGRGHEFIDPPTISSYVLCPSPAA
jgi:hypothetical protein